MSRVVQTKEIKCLKKGKQVAFKEVEQSHTRNHFKSLDVTKLSGEERENTIGLSIFSEKMMMAQSKGEWWLMVDLNGKGN